MNSINWPASSVWVFVAQLGEHCSANAEATGSNPIEAPKNFFQAILQLLRLRFTAMATYSFQYVYCLSGIAEHDNEGRVITAEFESFYLVTSCEFAMIVVVVVVLIK